MPDAVHVSDKIVLATDKIHTLLCELLVLPDLRTEAFFTSGLTRCKFALVGNDLTIRDAGTWRGRCLHATAKRYQAQQNK